MTSATSWMLRRLTGVLSLVVVLGTVSHAQTTTKPAIEPKTKAKAEADKKVDLNTASVEELETIQGVGPAIAREIIAARPFKSIEELEKLKGIGATKFAAIKPHVKVTTVAATPKAKMVEPKAKTKTAAEPVTKLVDLNTADAETLQTLPGIGPVIASEIIAARPFKSVDELSKIKGLGEAKIAELKPRVKASEPIVAKTKAESPKMTKADTKKAEPKAKAKAKEVVENEGELSAKAQKLTDSGKKIDINTANAETLMELPGVGPAKSKAIIEARPFKTIDEITNANGIGEVTFGHLKNFITVK